MHFKSKHEGKKLKCNICDKKYSYSSGLNTHINTAHKSKSFSCNICGKSYSQNSHLRTHMKDSHFSEKSQCKMCEYRGTPLNLKSHFKIRHMQTHEYLKCSTCSYVGKNKNCLRQHVKTFHTGQGKKLYKCDTCAYQSTISRYLITHKKNVHLKQKINI